MNSVIHIFNKNRCYCTTFCTTNTGSATCYRIVQRTAANITTIDFYASAVFTVSGSNTGSRHTSCIDFAAKDLDVTAVISIGATNTGSIVTSASIQIAAVFMLSNRQGFVGIDKDSRETRSKGLYFVIAFQDDSEIVVCGNTSMRITRIRQRTITIDICIIQGNSSGFIHRQAQTHHRFTGNHISISHIDLIRFFVGAQINCFCICANCYQQSEREK